MPEVRLIDANALKEHYNVPDAEGVFSYCDTIMEVIDSQPTIEAELVRHGRWIEGTSRGSYSIYCSCCGSHKETICPTDYCPNCGARMDGGADNG